MKRLFPTAGLGRCGATVVDGYVYAVAYDPIDTQGIASQSKNTFQELDRRLKKAGSHKDSLIQVTVYLSDISNKAEMDKVWCEWMGPDESNWPQRACVGVQLAKGCLIEVVVIAKAKDNG